MRKEVTYIANDGTKFTSSDDCMAHDKKLEERDATNKEKIALLESIKNKYNSLIEDIENYQTKYREVILLSGNKLSRMTISKALHDFFYMV